MVSRAELRARLARVKPNLLDRAIGYVAPRAAAERHRARQVLALTGGGYTGGKPGRKVLQNWGVNRGSDADSDVLPDLELLRDRSRDLVRNNSLAAGAINTNVTSIVGGGLKLQSEIDFRFLGLTREQAEEWQAAAEREYNLFASKKVTIDGELNFAAMQQLVLRSKLESGDVFAIRRFKKRPGQLHALKFQLVEADRICNTDFGPDTPTLIQGIEKNDDGMPIRLHVASAHPTSLNNQGVTWTKVPYWDEKTNLPWVLHIKKPLRPGMTRDVPTLAPVIEVIKQLGEYKQTEVDAAVVTSMFTVFVKSTTGESTLSAEDAILGGGGLDRDSDVALGSGAVVELAENESIETANPLRPNTAFGDFVHAVTKEIGMALEIPHEVLTKHFSASYSASQAALLEAWRYFNMMRDWLVDSLCNPVYEMFLYEVVASGRLPAPGFFDDPLVRAAYCGARWIGPPKGHVNEEVSAKAAEKRIELELTTTKQEAAALGNDYNRNHHQRAHEERQAREDGTHKDTTPANSNPIDLTGGNTDDARQ